MSFNLRAAALEVIDAHDSVDPAVLASALLPLVPDEELGLMLLGLLRSYVRDILGEIRRGGGRAEPHLTLLKPWVDDENDPNMLPAPAPSKARAKSSRSWRVDGMRAEHQAWLDAAFPGADGEWKRRSEMTFADLMAAASQRRDLAKANETEADKLERIAAALTDAGVETVGALPVHVIEKLAA